MPPPPPASTATPYFPDLFTALAALHAVVILTHLAIYLVDPYGLRTIMGHRSEVIHKMHLKYGRFVRISPSEVSVADPEALGIVYAHGNDALKSTFYDPFVSIEPGLFNTCDRKQHTRKRKIASHIFSQKSVVEFEPHIRLYVGMLLAQWDRLYDSAAKGLSGTDGAGGWFGRDGRLLTATYQGATSAPPPSSLATRADDVVHIPAVSVLTGRGEYSMSMGVLPAWVRPIMARVPWYRRGLQDVLQLAGIAIVAVAKRLAAPTDRVDLLSKLQAGTDDAGNSIWRAELAAEAFTFLIASSDTMAKCAPRLLVCYGLTPPSSTCAILYHLAANPGAQEKLQQELDEQLGAEDERVATGDQVKRLPFLGACIDEVLRIHSTSALGLPRVVPEGGLVLSDKDALGEEAHFRAGAVLSVPSYTIHRDPAVWGADVDAFRPERWFEADKTDGMQRTFNPFSIIVASIVRRFHFVLARPEEPLATREGFLRKPLRCDVGIKRRDVL
ncbi:cytochrome P450 monooxygenase [Mycena rebaudengoi]|nr:cytochrome P450 monooxygenase [Mycena rebaudengoi]